MRLKSLRNDSTPYKYQKCCNLHFLKMQTVKNILRTLMRIEIPSEAEHGLLEMLSTSVGSAVSLLCHGHLDDLMVADARPDLTISKPARIHVHSPIPEGKLTTRTAGLR
jgi:hypothetical protein